MVLVNKIYMSSLKSSLENPWWINSDKVSITPFDYPVKRVNDGKMYMVVNKLNIVELLYELKSTTNDTVELFYKICFLLQDNLIHNPVFQPSEEKNIIDKILSVKSNIYNLITLKLPASYQLITNPELLLLLGEARCGQVAEILVQLLNIVGISAKIEKLNNHIVANVILQNKEYLIDLDAFKNGIFFHKKGALLYTRKEILTDPTIVDQFKHTGWMFRKNTRYFKNINNIEFSGYIDFFMPENDGLISLKYGNLNAYLPPGIPIWIIENYNINLKPGNKVICSFEVPHEDRANYYLVRVCKKSKEYSYDYLIYDNLINESTMIVNEMKIYKTKFIFSEDKEGIYYVTVCAMSEYLEKNNSYVWWSDEIIIKVK